jgi:uncharacterized membrane protein YcaP (DUF421 family)
MVRHNPVWEAPVEVPDLFVLGEPLVEKLVRTAAVYAGLAILLRLDGKRDIAQLNTFDLLVMLLLSNVVQNAIIGDDDSLLGGLVGAATLIALNALVVRLVARDDRLSRVFEGSETVLVRNGEIDERALRREGLRRGDVVAALRHQGADSVQEVALAKLAPGGSVIVDLMPADRNASHGDVEALRREVHQLSTRLETVLGRLDST